MNTFSMISPLYYFLVTTFKFPEFSKFSSWTATSLSLSLPSTSTVAITPVIQLHLPG